MPASIDLASLLSPTGVPDFLEKSWARSAFVARAGQPGRFHGLLSVTEFEFLLSTVAAPGWLSFVKDVVQPPSRDQLTSDGTLDAGALYKAIADRQSLLLTRIHRLHPGIGTLCRQVAADLRAAGVVLRKAIRANAYFTPPQSQGFAAHYDDHDVLVLQLHGEKRWRIYGEAAKWPRKPMAQPLPAAFLASHAHEVTLQAGDALYLPRGFAHEARTTDQASLHVTLSIEVATWSDVFERLINLDDRLGEALPAGFCASGVPRPSDKARAAEFGSGMMRSPALDRAIADVFNRTRNEGDFPPNGHLARIASEAGIGPDTMLVATPGLSANVEQEGGVAILRLAGATLRADRQAAPLFRNLCEGKPFRLADLGKADDVEALLDLARELVSRGVLRAARDGP